MLLRACDLVHHLGDPGAEGQLLVDEVLEYFGNRKPVRRVTINDCNEVKLREAIEQIRGNDEAQFRSWHRWALARSRYDWLLGINCTRAMTLRGRALGYDGLFPVGSVQTPLLHIMVDRDRLIEAHRPTCFLSVAARLDHQNGSFSAKWQPVEDQAGLDPEGRLVDLKLARELRDRIGAQRGVITSHERHQEEEHPPLPLSLNELQIEAFRQYGYSAVEVTDAAQQLYQIYKVTTYPRSESRYLSKAAHAEAPRILRSIFALRPELGVHESCLDTRRVSAAFDAKLEGQDHHGIVPCVPDDSVDAAAWPRIERNVHELIVRSYLAQFAEASSATETLAEIRLGGEQFRAVSRTPTRSGWKAVLLRPPHQKPRPAVDQARVLPPMRPGDPVHCSNLEIGKEVTEPLLRFDEASMLTTMMNVHRFVEEPVARNRLKLGHVSAGEDGVGRGIGTPATRATIIAELKARQLIVPIEAGSKKLMTSPEARALIDSLPLDVRDPRQAGVFKMKLDLVASGSLSPNQFLDDTVHWISGVVQLARTVPMNVAQRGKKLRSAQRSSHTCLQCRHGRLTLARGAHGRYWKCMQAVAGCRATYPDKQGRPEIDPKSRPAI